MSELIQTRADLVRELRAAREHGLSERFLRANGITSIHACAAELMRCGYEVEVLTDGGGMRTLRLIATPDVGKRERKKAWLPLFGSESARGPYDQ